MSRERVVNLAGCVALLSRLVRRSLKPVTVDGVIVACRPVLASENTQKVTRRVLDAVATVAPGG